MRAPAHIVEFQSPFIIVQERAVQYLSRKISLFYCIYYYFPNGSVGVLNEAPEILGCETTTITLKTQ